MHQTLLSTNRFLYTQFIIPSLKHGIDVLLDQKTKVENQHKRVNTISASGHICPHQKKNEDMAIGLELNNVAARPRKSPFPMITVKDAQETVLKYCKNRPLDTETIDFMDAINRYSMQFEGIHKPRGQLKGGGGYLET